MVIKDILFKVVIFIFTVFYYFYALVVSKQAKIMDKTLQDEHNGLILFITSFQVTVSLVLLLILILTIFLF